MKLSPHFTLAEFTHSETAARRGLDNSVPAELMEEARKTAELMERIRAVLTTLKKAPVPIFITSGYRGDALNAAIGGSKNSDHMRAKAVDFVAPAFGSPYEICKVLESRAVVLGIGQLIHEYGRWVHVGRSIPTNSVNRLLTVGYGSTKAGIHRI
jgi:hypothetical protein